MRGSIAGLTGRGGVAGVDAATETSGGTRDIFSALVRTSADVGGTYDPVAGTITLGANGAFDDMGGPHNTGTWDNVQENVGPGLNLGSRFLIASQSDEAENGIYELTIMGDAGTPPVFTRIADPMYPGLIVRTIAGGGDQASYHLNYGGGTIADDGEMALSASKTFTNPIQSYNAGELLTLTTTTFAAKRIATPNLTNVPTLLGRRASAAPVAGDRGAIVADRIYLIPFHTMVLPYAKIGAIVNGPGGGLIRIGIYLWDGTLSLGAKPTTFYQGGGALAVPASGVVENDVGAAELPAGSYFWALWADTAGAANSFERHKAGDLFGFNGAVNSTALLQGVVGFYSTHAFHETDPFPELAAMTLVPIVDDGAAKVPVVYVAP